MVLPMDINSTPYVRYNEINVDQTDLLDDAWGFSAQFGDVFALLNCLKPEPEPGIAERLIEIIKGKQ